MNRRHMLLAAGATLAAPNLAHAQGATWPDRPLRLIVPQPPAGGTDVVSREMAARLTAVSGWTVVVENRTGAGGNIGIDAVVKSTDDHTIGMGQTANLAINPTLYAANIPYQPLRDLSLISLVATQPNVLVVGKGSRLQSLADVVAAARAAPGGLTCGHPGSGTVGHLAAEIFKRRAGIDVLIIPYRGGAQVSTDLIAGRLDLFFANPLAVRGMLEGGEMRALAVTSAGRLRTMPTVPTVAESGYPGFEAVNWTGLVAPARMPPAIVGRINAEVRRALTSQAMIERLAAEGSDPTPSTPDEFRTFLTAEIEKWGKAVTDARVQVD
ncbi:Bug family tripartite tricarboxylate transporter substrate binding protein [Humitalea sp. 24SJ18S-53]|uniref:Bug family tripartite tricarboxylate transporter substrate binding protein n=1 Tax=Humitalea sp. 24SJ18S-53 TaxID=3422307 RepID=UPI003D6719D1